MLFYTRHTRLDQDQEGHWFLLVYNLLEERKWDGTRYGIEIELVREDWAEKSFRMNLTPNLARAESLLTLLARNYVTPAGIADVLEEWL